MSDDRALPTPRPEDFLDDRGRFDGHRYVRAEVAARGPRAYGPAVKAAWAYVQRRQEDLSAHPPRPAGAVAQPPMVTAQQVSQAAQAARHDLERIRARYGAAGAREIVKLGREKLGVTLADVMPSEGATLSEVHAKALQLRAVLEAGTLEAVLFSSDAVERGLRWQAMLQPARGGGGAAPDPMD